MQQQHEASYERYTPPAADLTETRERKQKKKAKELPGLSVEEIIPTRSPAEYAVDGLDLMAGLQESLKKYISLPRHAAPAVCYWVLHTYCLDATKISPRLHIKSPEMRCGKSTLLAWLERLVYKPMLAGSSTYSALFQIICDNKPTVLLDEVDNWVMGGGNGSVNNEIHGVINNGYRHDGKVIKTVNGNGKEHVPRAFPVYGAMALGGIRDIPRTAADRSIAIALERKPASFSIEPMPDNTFPEFIKLAGECQRWANDNKQKLKEILPELPQEIISDRAKDNWRPLFAIAELIGDNTSKLTRAAVALSESSESTDHGNLLLYDIREFFEKHPTQDHIFSRELDNYLMELEERPWSNFYNGKPIAPRKRAKLLSAYKITSSAIERGGKNAKGYLKKHFDKVFAQYLAPLPPRFAVKPSEVKQTAGYSKNISVRNKSDLTDKKTPKATDSNGPDALTDKTPPEWLNEAIQKEKAFKKDKALDQAFELRADEH